MILRKLFLILLNWNVFQLNETTYTSCYSSVFYSNSPQFFTFKFIWGQTMSQKESKKCYAKDYSRSASALSWGRKINHTCAALKNTIGETLWNWKNTWNLKLFGPLCWYWERNIRTQAPQLHFLLCCCKMHMYLTGWKQNFKHNWGPLLWTK